MLLTSIGLSCLPDRVVTTVAMQESPSPSKRGVEYEILNEDPNGAMTGITAVESKSSMRAGITSVEVELSVADVKEACTDTSTMRVPTARALRCIVFSSFCPAARTPSSTSLMRLLVSCSSSEILASVHCQRSRYIAWKTGLLTVALVAWMQKCGKDQMHLTVVVVGNLDQYGYSLILERHR